MSDWKHNALPTLEMSPELVKQYMARSINPLSPRRRWVTQRAALNSWMYHGRQWIEPVGELSAGLGVYHFREVYKQSLASYKRPVTNIIAPAVDNEVARLTKKEYEPETAADRTEPDWIFAAKLAKDIVTWQMLKVLWKEKREQLAFNLCIDETALVRSLWQDDITDLVAVASQDAVVCSSCEAKLASAELPASMVETGIPKEEGGFSEFMGAESLEEMPYVKGRPHRVKAKHCPFCPTGELNKYSPSEEEVTEVPDALGNPLGRMLPKGEDAVEVISLHEFYPENGGIGIEPYASKVWHQMRAEPIEDIVRKFPQFERTIQPDDPQKILRLNPLYSDPALVAQGLLFGLGAGGLDAYQNHALVQEVIVAPQKRAGLELGAHFIMVNDKLISRALCVEVESEGGAVELVPRVKYHVARGKRVPGMFWGRGFVSDLIPLQRRLNELDAQVIDLRERGKPMMWTPQGVELYFRRDTEGSLQIMEYEAPSTWTPRDGLFPGLPMTGNPYMAERAQIMVDAQLIGTPQDVELGKGAGGIKTTSGLMLASEQAGERRAPKERQLVHLYEGVFQHVLDMQKTFRKEPTQYRVESDSGLHEVATFDSTKLVGTIKLRMKATASYDVALYEKEAASEAIQMGLYKMENPVAVNRALELMRLPTDVNEEQGIQIRRAEMAWSDFLREKKVPLLDSLFDPLIWYPIFQRRWLSDECLILQREAKFEETWARLAGWQEELAMAEAKDAALRKLYGSIPEDQWQQVHAQATQMYESAVNQARAVGLIPAQGDPPPGSGLESPPPPPPEDGFLPKALELRIFTIWEQMLGPFLEDAQLGVDASKRVGVAISPEAEAATLLLLLLKMRAVIEALRKMLEAMLAPPPPPGGAPPPEGGPPPKGGPPAQ